ncbi:arabinofuranosidase catalytic domain-containing protein [Actinoallomurus rhizosphaericola]|uniref:arabinofuranosidase catalytic domain-containing protein n=1 Tax=Actinoallomurus rhizosphaericola TaxID=2952536 RepID=UPI002092497A|nr:arabinofuranosidase catalytic domain-containing protein [Actinoallomurus rhizosphaericola]MCO5995631.1 RICIN domain-containing protein [Actinoallomurus rhizosphaericola]
MFPAPKGRPRVWRLLAACLLAVAAAVLALGTQAAVNTASAASLPCDIYAAGGTPCIAAHSTTRALFASYSGPLYQVQRKSDQKYLDIGLLSAGGSVDAAPQVSFCAGTSCTITKIYDQTANHNDLPISSGGYWKGPGPNGADIGADAMALPITVAGHPAYGIKSTPGTGYRIDHAKGAPTGSQPEGIYMVTSSNYVNQWCCFDYGSGENSHTDTGNATMNAIYWGTACWFGGCTGSGPWVEADLENGMYHTGTGSNHDPNNSGVHFPFVSAWEKNNGTSNFTLKYGNATSGGLTTPYSGPLPNGYSPMRTDSSILLGTGGDNSVSGQGEFFEGAVTSGYPSDATENAVQASITAAGYGAGGSSGGSYPSGYHPLVVGNNGLCLDVYGNSTASGAAIDQWSCNGQSNQLFQFVPGSNGYGELQAQSSGQVVGVSGGSTAQGTPDIVQQARSGAASTMWKPVAQSDGSWSFQNSGSGLCLDVYGAGSNQGQQLDQWPCKNAAGSNQDFTPR